MGFLYLDNNATTRPSDAVVAAMDEAQRQLWANPSSVHRFGQMVRQRVELARNQLANLLNCKDRELVLTSGGTESNNLALRGVLEAQGGVTTTNSGEGPEAVLITTPVEHSAVREPVEAFANMGVRIVQLPVNIDGCVSVADLDAALKEAGQRQQLALVSIQWANNETGIIQPIEAIAAAVKKARDENVARALLHVDGTQAVGKIPVDVKAAGLDLMTLSAHKFHGPKGVGALYVRTGVRLRPQQRGGPQERERRGGTENTPAIIGMGVAADEAQAFVQDTDAIARLQALRDRFEQGVLQAISVAQINGARLPDTRRLWNTSNTAFPRIEAEAVLLALSEKGLCASAGAACSSGSLEPSPVLLAMGLEDPVAHGSVRFSLSRETTAAEIDQALEIIPPAVERLMQTLPMG